MQLYSWAGEETAATLRQYEECKRLLSEALQTAPDPETQALYEHNSQPASTFAFSFIIARNFTSATAFVSQRADSHHESLYLCRTRARVGGTGGSIGKRAAAGGRSSLSLAAQAAARPRSCRSLPAAPKANAPICWRQAAPAMPIPASATPICPFARSCWPCPVTLRQRWQAG